MTDSDAAHCIVWPLGHRVFDRPSGLETTIVDVEQVADDAPEYEGLFNYYYTVADNIPLNPTGDNAFGDRGRCWFELCDTDSPLRNQPFRY